MTECLNDDDDEEANQRTFVSCFVTTYCGSTSGESIQPIEDNLPVYSRHCTTSGYGNGGGWHPKRDLLDHPDGELITG